MGKTKFELMSDCLSLFKQVPQIMENFDCSNIQGSLKCLLRCSSKFMELANESESINESEVALFYRFYCRLKEISYSHITYYLHTKTNLFIKQLLASINSKLAQHKAKQNNSKLLFQISSLLINNVRQIGISKQIPALVIESLISSFASSYANQQNQSIEPPNQIPYQTHQHQAAQPKQPRRWYGCSSANISNKNMRSKESEGQILSKSLGLDSIKDMDVTSLSKYQQSQNPQQLIKQCMSRNKVISTLIKRYELNYQSYQNKPATRRNKDNIHYRPTTCAKPSTTPARKTNLLYQSATQNGKSQFKRSRSKFCEISTVQNEMAAKVEKMDPQKQEIANQIYAYRQKYSVNKIFIGLNKIENKANPLHQTTRGINIYRSTKTNTQRSHTSNNCQNKSIKIKIVSNHTIFL